jgi:hypothetical protein
MHRTGGGPSRVPRDATTAPARGLVTASEAVAQSEALTLGLAALNVAQTALLAWIASRGTRRRRGDSVRARE